MATLLSRLRRAPAVQQERYGLDWLADQWQFAFQGSMYGGPSTTYGADRQEPIGNAFGPYVEAGYAANGVVFACILTRLLVFSEARFQWRQMVQGRPADLFGTAELAVLEQPWMNGTTGELLARMEQDMSLAGNSFWVRRRDRLIRLRPDTVTVVSGSPSGDWWDAEPAGYVARSPESGEIAMFAPEEVAHYSPIPDPLCRWRGMSWLTPVVREIQSDKAMTAHKLKFFENAATPNLAIKFDPAITAAQVEEFRRIVEDHHAGWENAYRTLYLGGGADPTVIGSTMEQMSFKTTQGHGETRIAAAAGVPPVLVGLSEGLQAATYSNYGQARRRFADGTIRPLWRMAAASLQKLVVAPPGADLWYDDRDIPFLREDERDAAEIAGVQSRTIRTLMDAGFDPDAAVQAAATGDMRALTGTHTGLYSVQLQPPDPEGGDNDEPQSAMAAAGHNGNGMAQ